MVLNPSWAIARRGLFLHTSDMRKHLNTLCCPLCAVHRPSSMLGLQPKSLCTKLNPLENHWMLMVCVSQWKWCWRWGRSLRLRVWWWWGWRGVWRPDEGRVGTTTGELTEMVLQVNMFRFASHKMPRLVTETGRDGHQELLSNGNQTDWGEIHRDAGLHRESEHSQTH